MTMLRAMPSPALPIKVGSLKGVGVLMRITAPCGVSTILVEGAFYKSSISKTSAFQEIFKGFIVCFDIGLELYPFALVC